MDVRRLNLLVIGISVTLVLLLPYLVASAQAAEPSLEAIMTTLGFNNVAISAVETFPSGLYEVTLYAEFAGYHATNELSYYVVNTSDFTLLFAGPEGNSGYTTPPVNKTFLSSNTFGISMYVPAEGHRYFTEQSLNPDGKNHSKVYQNLDEPDMYIIGFENQYGGGDGDYNDMVVTMHPVKHYLVVETDPSEVTIVPGEGWYSYCTNVTLTAPDTVSASPGVRHKFSHWTIDAISQGNGVNPITVHVDDNHTATAHYNLQFYLTVTSPYAIPSGEAWYASGETAYAALDAGAVDHGNGTRRVFASWTGDSTGTDYSLSDPILMDAPKTAIADWQTQYYLTLETNPGGVTTPSGEGWYNAETSAPVSTDETVAIVPESSRYEFIDWTTADMFEITNPSSPSTTVLMDKPKTVTANYKIQYYLTVTSPYDTPGGEGWYDSGSTAYGTLASGTVDHGNGTRRLFTNWGGDTSGTDHSQSTLILMDGPKTAIANWKTQYYLMVAVDPTGIATVPGEGWYDQSSDVALVAPSVSGYTFLNWQVDGVPGSPGVKSISVGMSAPHTAVAYYRVVVVGGFAIDIESPLIHIWGGVHALLIGGIFVGAFWRKRKQLTP